MQIDFHFWSNIKHEFVADIQTYSEYLDILKNEYSILTPVNAMKWRPLRPARDRFDFTRANSIMEFAQEHQQKIHGHTLVWHNQNPDWLINGAFTSAEKEQILREHIQTVITHFNTNYPEQIVRWDVVNEAFEDSRQSGQLRTTLWSDVGSAPTDYIRIAFEQARLYAPQAKLLYNDFSIEGINAKSTAVLNLMTNLKNQGVPIDGVGMQAHLNADLNVLSVAEIRNNMDRFAAQGFEIYITEFDFRYNATGGFSQAEMSNAVASYNNFAQACSETPMCRGFTTWGSVPSLSWIPNAFNGFEAFLPFDDQYQPTSAYEALQSHF